MHIYIQGTQPPSACAINLHLCDVNGGERAAEWLGGGRGVSSSGYIHRTQETATQSDVATAYKNIT